MGSSPIQVANPFLICFEFYIDASVAQSVEQRTENPRVTGSIPVLGTLFVNKYLWDISSVGRALDF